MKTLIGIVALFIALVSPFHAPAIEKAPRITDREIVERLTKVETKVDEGFRAMDKRFEAMDKRFEAMEGQFNRLTNIMLGMLGAFVTLLGGTIWFALWDRRTTLRPVENKFETILSALRDLGKTDEKVAEVLRKFNLL